MANSPDPRDDQVPDPGAETGDPAGQGRPDQGGGATTPGQTRQDPATGGEGAAGAGGSGGFGT